MTQLCQAGAHHLSTGHRSMSVRQYLYKNICNINVSSIVVCLHSQQLLFTPCPCLMNEYQNTKTCFSSVQIKFWAERRGLYNKSWIRHCPESDGASVSLMSASPPSQPCPPPHPSCCGIHLGHLSAVNMPPAAISAREIFHTQTQADTV